MKKFIKGVFLILGVLLNLSAIAASTPCPTYGPDQSHVQAELTPTGIQKLAVWGAGLSLDKLTSDPSSIPISKNTVSPNSADCTPEKMEGYSTSERWANCYGLPKGWVDGPKTQLKQWLTPVASAFSFSNSKLNEISFGDLVIDQCTVSSCHVSLPLKHLDLTTDLTVNRIIPPPDPKAVSSVFSVKGLDTSITASPEAPIMITGVIKIDSHGRLGQLVQIDPRSIQFKLPPGSVHTDLAHTDADDARMKTLMALDVYISLQKKFDLPRTAKDSEIQSIVGNLPPRITQTPEFRDAVANAYIAETTPRFNNKRSAELFQSGQWVFSNLTKNPAFTEVLNRMLGSTLVPKLTGIVNEQLKTIPMIGTDYVESLPIARPQNTIELNLITKKFALQSQNLKAAIAQLQARTDSLKASATVGNEFTRAQHLSMTINDMTSSVGVPEVLGPTIKDWTQLKNTLDQRIQEDSLSVDLLQMYQKMRQQCDQTLSLLNAEQAHMLNMVNPSENFILRLSSAQADEVNQVIRAGLTVCTDCGNPQIPPGGAPTASSFKPIKDYDAAIKINLATINTYLTTMYNKDSWDLCVAGKKSNDSDCDKFHFIGSPSLTWNGHSLALNIPKVEYNGVVTACGQVDLALGTSQDQSSVKIAPTDMHMSFCLNHSTVWKSILSIVEAVSLVVPVGETAALNMFKSDILSQMGTPEVALPPELKLQSVKTDATGITVYGNLNLSGPIQGTSTKP